jgi:hypothetical protein
MSEGTLADADLTGDSPTPPPPGPSASTPTRGGVLVDETP